MPEICRQNIWDVRKFPKWSHPLQDDETKWLADRINNGLSHESAFTASDGEHEKFAKQMPSRVSSRA